MSHETPKSSKNAPIDTSRPYLIPRGDDVEEWHVETNPDGTPKVDDQGWVMLSSSKQELDDDGKTITPAKTVDPEILGDDAQRFFADQRDALRPTTPERFERDETVNEDLGEKALSAVGLEGDEAREDSHDEELEKVKEAIERVLKSIDQTMPMVIDQAESLRYLLDGVVTQVHNGMSDDDSDSRVMTQYYSQVETINTTVNYMLSQLNQLKLQSEKLDSNDFDEGTKAAAVRDRLEKICNGAATFIQSAPVLNLMREFSNAHEDYHVKSTAADLRRTAADGTLEQLAANQQDFMRAFSE